jgi:hypothetical protein
VLELQIHIHNVVHNHLDLIAVRPPVKTIAQRRPQIDVLRLGRRIGNHHDIEVAVLATPIVLHPVAPRMTAVQDDHLNLGSVADHLDDVRQVSPLGLGQVIERVIHRVDVTLSHEVCGTHSAALAPSVAFALFSPQTSPHPALARNSAARSQ